MKDCLQGYLLMQYNLICIDQAVPRIVSKKLASDQTHLSFHGDMS